MADPLSITASALAIITAAIQSTRSLSETVKRYKGRDTTLRRLQDELEGLTNILDTLREVVDLEVSMMALLKGPVDRCSQACREFENSMKQFDGKSKVGFRDWTKMEFMRGNINDFMDTLVGYKSTISIGLGTITMHTSKISHQVLEEYNEMIKDTVYNLNIHLQRIDEKLGLLTKESTGNTSVLDISIDLEDERAVTEQCLRICEDAKSYIESLADGETSWKGPTPPQTSADTHNQFEAQLLIRKVLGENRDNLAQTIGRLRERLESLPMDGTPQNDLERLRLQEEIKTSTQCLEVCKMASSEVAHQKVYRVGELIADGDSDQVVVTTLADLFDVKRASSTGGSAQWIGSMNDETVRQVSKDRYGSRFGAVISAETSNILPSSTSDTKRVSSYLPHQAEKDGQSSRLDAARTRASANEMRKRTTEGDKGKGMMPSNE